MPKPYRQLLGNQNFLKVWLSQIFSQFTLNIINFLLITQIFELTASTLAVSLLWIFYSLPVIFLGPFSGFLVDIWDKRKIMMVTNFLQALTIFSLLAIHHRFYFIYVIVFTYAVLNQFYAPSEAAVIPALVKKDALAAANSLFLFTAQLSFLVGFGSASILLKFLSRQETIFLSGVLLLLAAAVVALLPANKLISHRRRFSDWAHLTDDIQAGIKFLFRSGRLVFLGFLVIALFQMAATSAATILPVLAREILHRSLREAGIILIVPLALGLIFGSYFFGRADRKIRKKEWIVSGAVAAGIFIILTAFLDYFSYSYRGRALLASLFLLGLGIALALVVVPAQTFIQEFTPAKIRGRVFSLLNVTVNLAAIPPLLVMATIIDIFGVRLLLLIVGSLAIILGALTISHGDRIIADTYHRA